MKDANEVLKFIHTAIQDEIEYDDELPKMVVSKPIVNNMILEVDRDQWIISVKKAR